MLEILTIIYIQRNLRKEFKNSQKLQSKNRQKIQSKKKQEKNQKAGYHLAAG
jgi:hypothetical protein